MMALDRKEEIFTLILDIKEDLEVYFYLFKKGSRRS